MAGSFKKARKMYLQMVQSVQISRRPPKATKVDGPAISFIEEDARQLHHPHDNALVVSLSIASFNTRQVLVDNGISVDILYYLTFQQMRVDKEAFRHTFSRIRWHQGLSHRNHHFASNHSNIPSAAH